MDNKSTNAGTGGLVVRDARLEELDEVSLLLSEAYQEYKRYFPPGQWKLYLENVMDVRSRLGVSELIIAELDGRLAGAVTLYPDASASDTESWPKGWAGIRLLGVNPAFRRKGIGRALMTECIERCRRRGIRTLGLHTALIMDAALRMYEKMGFVRVPEFDYHPVPDTTVMAYSLRL